MPAPLLAGYTQVYDPIGGSLGLSSIVAVLPLVVLFVLLGVHASRALGCASSPV